MPTYSTKRARKPWLPWVKVLLVVIAVGGTGYGLLEVAQRYLGLQKLTIEQVMVSGCKGDRLEEVQAIANDICRGKPLFWFDAESLRQRVEALRWVRGLLIRRDPPDRVALVIEERKPLLWISRPNGVFLLSDDGIVLDGLSQANAAPIPVVSDPASQQDEALAHLIRTAATLRDLVPNDFFHRLVELRWSPRGPVAFIEGLDAPIYLSKVDPARNIPNFQGIYLSIYANHAHPESIRYFDLRWEGEIAVGEDQETQEPKTVSK